MDNNKFQFWQKFLTYANIMAIIVGIVVAFAGNSILLEIHNEYTRDVFFGASEFTPEVLKLKNWLFGIIGGSIVGYHVLIIMVSENAFRKKEPWAFHAIWISLLSWFLIDSGISIYYGAIHNVVIINLAALILILIPLIATRKEFIKSSPSRQPFYYIFLLIIAAESVFILPFVLPRIFRPTFLELFQVDNLQLGLCFSFYGIVAVIAYFIGGMVADQFKPGRLMGIALILTALGGYFLAQYPSIRSLKYLYAYWGMTTIFLFWAAMIKATRMWGGRDRQGKAFGFLDGGRGLVAAGFGSLGLFVLSLYLIGDIESLSFEEKRGAFQKLIWTFSGVVCVVGIVVFFVLNPKDATEIVGESKEKVKIFSLSSISQALKLKVIWLIMVIILTGYCGYKITDIFSLYAKDVMQYDEIKAASIGTMLLYIRPALGIVIGFLADRSRSSLWILIGFVVMMLGSAVIASGVIGPNTAAIFGFSIFVTSLGVYALRSLYFAVMEEGNIPLTLTGTVVGIVSVIGYTPDIFMGPLIGILLDNNPGELGHQYVFAFMSIVAFIGMIASFLFRKWTKS